VRAVLAVLAAALVLSGLAGCGARYAVRLEGWGMQVELSVDTREVDARREANTPAAGAPSTDSASAPD